MAYFGLNLGLDLEMRAAHPHQRFQGVPHPHPGVKLSEIVGCSCVECHSSNKTNFNELILFYVGTTDFFIHVFQKKNCPNFVAVYL